MTLKKDAKFKEELTCRFQIDMTNLTNFDPSTQNYGVLLTNVNVQAKKSTEQLSFMTLKSDNKFEEKMTCGLENDTRNLMGALESLKNFHFKPNLGVCVCVCVCVGGGG